MILGLVFVSRDFEVGMVLPLWRVVFTLLILQ